ncbi:hypothetical protein N7539_005846 [Penicillium diatomitis]|uniref:Zn(2)-C6 fungal-type domain-containing protein n=1 Tax=Penicillium diatomitis TaxID=2819901 RepID=A0A9W9X5L7_9EURO|nr:uncharacterized protein N7539_005846 [Penicillium diatomitis]KAJ5484050.1 hypothetical protein N7539_005846 [Penicillium diatomitis]
MTGPLEAEGPSGPAVSAISSIDGPKPAEQPAAKQSAARKGPKRRTKTGCLTCRRRRIKCGEEKPTCSNCVKSKRICEGYARRVIFKNPLGLVGSYGTISAHGQLQQQQQPQPQQGSVPVYNHWTASFAQAQHVEAAPGQHPMLAPRPVDPAALEHHIAPIYEATPPIGQTHAPSAPSFYYPASARQVHGQEWPAQNAQSSAHQPQSTIPQPSTLPHQGLVASNMIGEADRSLPAQSLQFGDSTADADRRIPQAPQAIVYWTNEQLSQDIGFGTVKPAQWQTEMPTGLKAPSISQPDNSLAAGYQFPAQDKLGRWQSDAPQHPEQLDQRQLVYVDDENNDYYDVDSDDEMAGPSQLEGFNQLSLIMASANHDESRFRSFTAHLNEPNILASYTPSLGSSPLNNPTTARIFAHFIHSTGPSLSIFERHPTDSSISLGAVLPAQQGLWTYTLPLKALENPALLQAILAISSLHIAYLQGTSTTVSLRHYHYALKKIGQAVSLPLPRREIGTLAATELLAYYEVISADHSKWNSHVAGAAQLIKEVDFAGTTRDLRTYRRVISAQRDQLGWSNSSIYDHGFGSESSEHDPFAEKETSVNEHLIGSILGRAVNFDDFGRVDIGQPRLFKKNFTRKEIENFRIQCDLYWWFTKQDVFHSFISGEKLFMPYSMQCQCPPRAGVGRIDAIYGSADHLWLLLARVSDFGYRDRKRKIRALRAAGTEWRPSPGMFKFMGRFSSKRDPNARRDSPGTAPARTPPPSGPPSGPSGSHGSRPSPSDSDSTPMYGMVPPHGPARLPSGFADGPRDRQPSFQEEERSEGVTYAEAEQEWEEIFAAMDTLAKEFGRNFEPLPADVTQSIPTPFGPALQYRTHTIAVIWGFYYAARILLYRLHPSMPPAMMMAAGVAAATTAEYAQIIGRITGGIYYPQRFNLQAGSLSPTLGSSLTEMTVPIFFAGVQYMDPAQRGWTVAKLRDISRLTGWKTSEAIASGCEKAWIVAAKHGRGPPYERTSEVDQTRGPPALDLLERDGGQSNDERRFVTVDTHDRAHYAMGLLSLDADMQSLEL